MRVLRFLAALALVPIAAFLSDETLDNVARWARR